MKTRFSSTEPPAPPGYVNGKFAEVLEDGVRKVAIHVPTGAGGSPVGGGVEAFTDLVDVPSTYAGQEDKLVAVRTDGTGLKFIPSSESSPPDGGGNGWYPAFTAPPAVSNWAWVNQGAASAADVTGGILFKPDRGTSNNVNLFKKAAPAIAYKLTVGFLQAIYAPNSNTSWLGLAWRESGSGFIITVSPMGAQDGGIGFFRLDRWNSATSYNGNYISGNGLQNGGPIWLELEDDHTDRIVRIGPHPDDMIEVHRVSRTHFGTMDEIGLFGYIQHSSAIAAMRLIHWNIT